MHSPRTLHFLPHQKQASAPLPILIGYNGPPACYPWGKTIPNLTRMLCEAIQSECFPSEDLNSLSSCTEGASHIIIWWSVILRTVYQKETYFCITSTLCYNTEPLVVQMMIPQVGVLRLCGLCHTGVLFSSIVFDRRTERFISLPLTRITGCFLSSKLS